MFVSAPGSLGECWKELTQYGFHKSPCFLLYSKQSLKQIKYEFKIQDKLAGKL